MGNTYESIEHYLTDILDDILQRYSGQKKGLFISNDTQANVLVSGNVKDGGMKRLLCQIGKEAEDFRIIRLEHIL